MIDLSRRGNRSSLDMLQTTFKKVLRGLSGFSLKDRQNTKKHKTVEGYEKGRSEANPDTHKQTNMTSFLKSTRMENR